MDAFDARTKTITSEEQPKQSNEFNTKGAIICGVLGGVTGAYIGSHIGKKYDDKK